MRPPDSFWQDELCASRLLQYEVWTRVNANGKGRELGDSVRAMLSRVELVELDALHLERALAPFPVGVRTLDAIHLATAHYLREAGETVVVASYDARFRAAAERMGFGLAGL